MSPGDERKAERPRGDDDSGPLAATVGLGQSERAARPLANGCTGGASPPAEPTAGHQQDQLDDTPMAQGQVQAVEPTALSSHVAPTSAVADGPPDGPATAASAPDKSGPTTPPQQQQTLTVDTEMAGDADGQMPPTHVDTSPGHMRSKRPRVVQLSDSSSNLVEAGRFSAAGAAAAAAASTPATPSVNSTITTYLATLPPLQPIVHQRTAAPSRRHLAAATKAAASSAEEYSKELRKLAPSKLLQACVSLHAEVESLRREQQQLQRSAPPSALGWMDVVDMYSIELGTETSDRVSHSSAFAPQYSTTPATRAFVRPTLQSCNCTCECVTTSTCFCRCGNSHTETIPAASSSSSNTMQGSGGCSCKCFCAQPQNWPRSLPYSHQLDWSAASIATASSKGATSSGPLLSLRDRLSIRPPSRFALGPSSYARNSLGVFALAPIRRGQMQLMDVAGQVRITDRRSWFGKGQYDEARWAHIPLQSNSSDYPSSSSSSSSSFLVELSPATYALPFQFDIDMERMGNESRFLQARSPARSNVRFTAYRDAITGDQRVGLECTHEIAIGDELFVDDTSRRSTVEHARGPSAAFSPHRQQEKKKRRRDTDATTLAAPTAAGAAGPSTWRAPLVEEDDLALASLLHPSTPTAKGASSAPPTWTVRDSDQQLCCTVCERAYPERTTLDFHWYKLHSTAFACSRCAFRGGNALKLQEHEQKHRRKEADAGRPHTPTSLAPPPLAIAPVAPIVPPPPPPAPVDPAAVISSAAASIKAKLEAKQKPKQAAAAAATATGQELKHSALEWLQLQAKRARLRATCEVSELLMFGFDLHQRPADVASQERSMEVFRRAPGSALHRERTVAERVWQPTTKAEEAATATSPTFSFIPRELYAVHDLPPGLHLATRTSLLGLPILAPSFHFPTSEFRLPAGFVMGGITRVHQDTAEGWGVTMKELKLFQKKCRPTGEQEASLKASRMRRLEPTFTGRYVCQIRTMKNAEVAFRSTESHPPAPGAAMRGIGVSHLRPENVGRIRILRVLHQQPNEDGSAGVAHRQVVGVFALAVDVCALANQKLDKFNHWSTAYRMSFQIPSRRSLPIPCRSTVWTAAGLLKLCMGPWKMQETERAPAAAWLLETVAARMVELEDPDWEFADEHEEGATSASSSVWQGRAESNPIFGRLHRTPKAPASDSNSGASASATPKPEAAPAHAPTTPLDDAEATEEDDEEADDEEQPSSRDASGPPSEDDEHDEQSAHGPPQNSASESEPDDDSDSEMPELIPAAPMPMPPPEYLADPPADTPTPEEGGAHAHDHGVAPMEVDEQP